MFSICTSPRHSFLLGRWKGRQLRASFISVTRRIGVAPRRIPCSVNDNSTLHYFDPSKELLELEVDSRPRNVRLFSEKERSWFGPNGQYIRELPCPGCRGRGYTPCPECGVDRSRPDCIQCTGKGVKTCRQCLGECVIWEESYDERPWEKARSRFATSYLTLQSLLDVRQPLEAMFTSTQWLSCAWAKKVEGKEIRKLILNDKFWAAVTYAILSTRPLVQVLRLVDAEKKPTMGFIYNAMDEAKELIAHNLGGDESSYREIWDIIDARWEVQLHRHLHAAAYYLNPQFQYSERKSVNPEIKLGLYHCMERLIPDQNAREIADLQLVLFRNKEGFFGLQAARATIAKRSPVEWWIQFGDSTPELQSFAVRVLGLTCSSSGCERNWSTYNQVQTKRRNRLSTLRMNSLVYIMYNKRLREKRLKNKGLKDDEDPLLCDDLASDNEWFIDDETNLPISDLHLEDLSVDVLRGEADQTGTSTSTTPHTSTSGVARKGKRKVGENEDDEDLAFLDAIEDDYASTEDPFSDGI